MEVPPLNSRTRADLALVLVSLLWGITFPLIRTSVQSIGPHQFVAYRFILAILVALPLVLRSRKARAALSISWWPGIALGMVAWSTYFSQTIGLQTISAGRGAFITGTGVIIVPLISPLFTSSRPGPKDFIAAVVALAGMYLLTDPSSGGFSSGDGWVLYCATGYAVYIHLLQKVLRSDPDPVALAFIQIVAVGVCALIILAATGDWKLQLTWPLVWALLICSLFATVLCFWLQSRFQKRTTPERAALIFALEPVFAAGFAYCLLGEILSPSALAGGALILLSVVGVELGNTRKNMADRARARRAGKAS